jgi:hypothetical protein
MVALLLYGLLLMKLLLRLLMLAAVMRQVQARAWLPHQVVQAVVLAV